jgi:NitT/TauT family transport system ATP-binding protein
MTTASPTPPWKLDLRGVCKTFRTSHGEFRALQDLDFHAAAGEFVCLIGPSGCGKTTTLNIIAGLEQADRGDVLIDGRPVAGPGPDRVVIFQEAALFPWLTVRDNVAFGLAAHGMPRAARHRLAEAQLEMVNLGDFAAASVHELSGGMKQRVALARALALNPQILLMDEPFAALDALAREALHLELQTLWSATGKTIVFVTHNVREALVLGDRVLVLSARPGRIKSEFICDLPRPRSMESHSLVDMAQAILADLRGEVQAAQEDVRRDWLAP